MPMGARCLGKGEAMNRRDLLKLAAAGPAAIIAAKLPVVPVVPAHVWDVALPSNPAVGQYFIIQNFHEQTVRISTWLGSCWHHQVIGDQERADRVAHI